MKKRFYVFSFLLVLISIISIIGITACDTGASVTGVNVYLDDKIVSADNKTARFTYDETIDIYGRVKVELVYDDGTTKVVDRGAQEYSITGLPEAFNAGTYALVVKYGEYDEVAVDLIIDKKQLTKPTVTGTYTYNGTEQKVAIVENLGYTISGNFQTNAGNYNATVTLSNTAEISNYIWADGESAALTLPWTIEKATPTTPAAVEGENGATLSTVVLPEGWTWADGLQILTASATFTASFAGNTNYNAVASANISVTVKSSPSFTPQTGLSATYGDTLADISFLTSVTDTPGSWAWVLPATTPVGNATGEGTRAFRATFTPTDTDTYAAKTIDVEIAVGKLAIAAPTIVGTNVFNGTQQTALIAESSYYTVSNNTATNAGSYSVIATLSDSANYKWEGSEIATTNISWTIEKVALTLLAVNLPDIIYSYTGSYYYYNFDKANFTYENGKYVVAANIALSEQVKADLIAGMTINIKTPYYFYMSGATKQSFAEPRVGETKLCVPFDISNVGDNCTITNVEEVAGAYNNIELDYNGRIIKGTPIITTPTASELPAGGGLLSSSIITGGEAKAIRTNNISAYNPSAFTNTTIAGTWTWNSPTANITESGTQYAVFTPDESNLYNTVMASVYVTVAPPAPAPSALEQVGLNGIDGLTADDLGYWQAGKFELEVKKVDLTIAQFDAIIANLNARYADDSDLAVWNTGKQSANPSSINISNPDNIEFTTSDYIYNLNNANGSNKYLIFVSAYEVSTNPGIIRLVGLEIYTADLYFANDANPEDIAKISTNGQFEGTVTWGAKSGRYTIDELSALLTVNFDDSTSATGSIDLTTGALVIDYAATTYNFTRVADFPDVDLTTGIDLRLYDQYNNYNNNGKFRISLTDYSEGMEIDMTYSEWVEGGARYLSVLTELYTVAPPAARTLVQTREMIYDLTNEQAYFYYKDESTSTSGYKAISFTDLITAVQEINASIGSIEQLYGEMQFSMYFFGGLSTSSTPLTEAELASLFCLTGEELVDGVSYAVEGYMRVDGSVLKAFIAADGSLAMPFEGGMYLIPDVTFTDFSIVGERAGYAAWDEASFTAILQDMYGSPSGGGEGGGEGGGSSTRQYEASNSDYTLNIIASSETEGNVYWGEVVGTYIMAQQGATEIYTLTIALAGEGGTITGAYNMSTDTITFTYSSIDYIFTPYVGGGEGGGSSTMTYEASNSGDLLYLSTSGSATSGGFAWGILAGSYDMVQQGVTDTYTLTITLAGEEAGTISGEYNMASDTITFTYSSVDYIFTPYVGGGEGGGPVEDIRNFESSDSEDRLNLNFSSATAGTFDWGALFGDFVMTQQGVTEIYDLTFTLSEGAGTITAVYDMSGDSITFTYQVTEYMFARVYPAPPASTVLFEGYNIPTNFKAVWNMNSSTFELVKVGEDVYFLSAGIPIYYKKTGDTYTKYAYNGEAWMNQGTETVEDIMSMFTLFIPSEDILRGTSSYTLMEPVDYAGFSGCRQYYNVDLLDTLLLHPTYDIVVQHTNFSQELTLFSTDYDNFADYAVSGLPV